MDTHGLLAEDLCPGVLFCSDAEAHDLLHSTLPWGMLGAREGRRVAEAAEKFVVIFFLDIYSINLVDHMSCYRLLFLKILSIKKYAISYFVLLYLLEC